MTGIPTRTAPPIPGAQRSQQVLAPPNTNMRASWDDTNFQAMPPSVPAFRNSLKKAAPPRPPPPSSTTQALPNIQQKKPSVLTNIFGSSAAKRLNKPPAPEKKVGPKLPAPPHSLSFQTTALPRPHGDPQLIKFDSPSSSPTFTQKSSDCASIDSFSSDSNYSSPNTVGGSTAGFSSTAESGFEDDFSLSDFGGKKSSRQDPFEMVDPFSPSTNNTQVPSNIRNVNKAGVNVVGNTSFYGSTAQIVSSSAPFDNPLCNGKNLLQTAPIISKPTIIMPKPSYKGKSSAAPRPPILPKPVLAPIVVNSSETVNPEDFYDEDEDYTSLPSMPMPNFSPPPLPADILLEVGSDESCDAYGITLYDFESDLDDDLNFKANEKIYITKKMNDEWLYGRNKRGCEGIFPISYIDIKVPLKETKPVQPVSQIYKEGASKSPSSFNGYQPAYVPSNVRVLYTFQAEAIEDLTIKEEEMVRVLHEINPEWLFGENSIGQQGQFPANFIEFVPANLPKMTSS